MQALHLVESPASGLVTGKEYKTMTEPLWFTVNTRGDNVAAAKAVGLHAYHANGVTAIEVLAEDEAAALKELRRLLDDIYVYYIFE